MVPGRDWGKGNVGEEWQVQATGSKIGTAVHWATWGIWPLFRSNCEWKWATHSVVSDALWPRGLWSSRLLHPWGFPGKNTGVGCRFLLQEIFPMQGSNPGLPHCRQTLYHLSHQGSPNCKWKVTFKISLHETGARGWCTGMTQRDGMGTEVGGGIGMGNTCKSMADSCQCMAKTAAIL